MKTWVRTWLPPKGLERDDADTEDVGPIFGEDKGLGVQKHCQSVAKALICDAFVV